METSQTLGIQVWFEEDELATTDSASPTNTQNYVVGCVMLQGLAPLTVPPEGNRQVTCKVDLRQPIDKEILMVDSPPATSLLAGMLLQPMVVPSHAVNVNNFRFQVQNKSLKETIIPVVTVTGNMYLTECDHCPSSQISITCF